MTNTTTKLLFYALTRLADFVLRFDIGDFPSDLDLKPALSRIGCDRLIVESFFIRIAGFDDWILSFPYPPLSESLHEAGATMERI
jgi:hypothetical protein